jgi:hypothetical protein
VIGGVSPISRVTRAFVTWELLSSPDKKKALAAMNAILKMTMLVRADLQRAFDET